MTEGAEEKLMAYLDGELEGEDAREVEGWLAGSAEARALRADFEQVGAAVRAIAETRGERSDGIVERVMAEVERSSARPVPPGSLAALPARSADPGSVRRLWLPAIGLSLAAAAAWALYLRPAPSSIPVPPAGSFVANSAEPAPEPQPGPAPEAVAVEEPEEGASIESVDFGAKNGTIFMVASGPQLTPVVWLVDEGAPGGDRMKPL